MPSIPLWKAKKKKRKKVTFEFSPYYKPEQVHWKNVWGNCPNHWGPNPQLWLLCARDALLPNELWQCMLYSEHFLNIFKLKLSQLEESNSLEVSP